MQTGIKGDIFFLQYIVFRHNDGLQDGVFKFAHIPVPVMRLKHFDNVLTNLNHVSIKPFVEFIQKMDY